MQGLAFTGFGFGGLTLAPLIGNYLVPNLGWQNTYVVMAFLVSAVIFPLTVSVVKDYPSQKGLRAYGEGAAELSDYHGAERTEVAGLNMGEALRTFTFWSIVGNTFFKRE